MDVLLRARAMLAHGMCIARCCGAGAGPRLSSADAMLAVAWAGWMCVGWCVQAVVGLLRVSGKHGLAPSDAMLMAGLEANPDPATVACVSEMWLRSCSFMSLLPA